MIETERLILREYTSDDFDALYEIMSDAETMQHYPAPFDEARTRRWIEWNMENYARYGFGLWAVVLKETGEMIGDCGITIQKIDGEDLPEIGYHIHKKYWRRGYAKEAALAVRDWAFENTDYPSLYSYCKYTNVASFKTAEAIGMHFEKEYADEVNKITHVSVIHRADTGKKAEYTQIQNELRKGISLCDGFEASELKTAAGVDLAYWKTEDGEYAVCCIVVIDMATHEVKEKRHFSGRIEVPYIPGFLAFRELPLVLKTAELLETKPDIYVFDGNGYLHPRHMGIATHASFYLDKPTFGVAKSYFRVDRQTDYVEPKNEAGSYTDIIIDGEVYGRALRTHKDVRPVFVSVGNHISLDTACHLAMILTDRESHIPVPTRLADLETHIERENARGKEGK